MQIKNTVISMTLNSIMMMLAGAAWEIVKAAVVAMEAPDVKGESKKAQVIEAVRAEFKEQQLSIGNSLLNLLVEAGVQIMKLKGSSSP